MRIAIASAALLFLLSLPSNAQVLPETAVSDVVDSVHSHERVAAAGSDGQNFLIAGVRGNDAVYAHRVTAAGQILDGNGIRIALPQRSFEPTVLGIFWAGDAYTLIITQGQATFVARIDADGHLLVPARQILSGGLFSGAASNGRRIVLASSMPAVLDLQGNLIEIIDNLPLPSGASHLIASNGDGFLMAWTQAGSNSVVLARLDQNGHPSGVAPAVSSIGAQSIASDGNDYVVVYDDPRGYTFTQHVGAAGNLMETHIVPRSGYSPNRIAWNGTSYILSALSRVPGPLSTPTAVRLDRTGAPLDPRVVSVAEGSLTLSEEPIVMAANGQQVLMAWPEGDFAATARWFGGLLGSDFTVGSKFAIGVTATLQVAPSVASDGRNLFTVWEESDAVYGSLISLLTGKPGNRIKLSSTPAHQPRVIWDGQAYVAAWLIGNTSMTTAQISRDGTLVAAGRPTFASCVDGFDLASGGGSTLVVASECFPAKRLLATQVHRDGSAEPPVVVSQTLSAHPRIAWNGAHYLAVWYEIVNQNGLDTPIYIGNVRAARISPSMTVLDPQSLPIAVTAQEENSLPLVASDGRDFMVTWTYDDQFNPQPRARLVRDDASLGEVMADFGPGTANSLVWDGRRFAFAMTTPSADLLLHHIGTDAVSPISATADPESSAAMVPLGEGVLAAAYVRTASEAIYGSVPRVFVKTLGLTRGRPVRGR